MQEIIVYALVAIAAIFVGRRYLPVGMRRAAARHLARLARACGLNRFAQRLEQAEPVASGCGACAGCTPASGASPGVQVISAPTTTRSGGSCH